MTEKKPPDLTGRRFGRWTVLEGSGRQYPGNHAYWLCRCDCGEQSSVRGTTLVDGGSTQCSSCRVKQMRPKYEDMTGRVFGKWTVLAKAHRDTSRKQHWLCECECGTKKTVEGSSLRRGMSKQCTTCRTQFRAPRHDRRLK